MHFLIGFATLCFIIAIPELRAAALGLIGLAGAGLLVVVLLLAAHEAGISWTQADWNAGISSG